MLHKSRIWSITPAESPESLAYMLTQQTWVLCSAFQLGNYFYLNDATSADGAQEYGVVRMFTRPELLVQVESITFSWCSIEAALELIQKINANEFDSQLLGRISARQVQTADEHGSCHLCV